MSISQPASALWPADIIHVNEDGWVLINRGSQHGVAVGLHLLVVGTGIRELHDLFAPGAAEALEPAPPILRIRRTYELLEVIYTEKTCAIAIATRTPTSRRPVVYRGPEGELLVWAPLPEGYSWPPPNSSTPTEPPASDESEATDDESSASSGDADAPPERAPQDDEPWEEALPLNSVSVGDIVLPAIPAAPSAPSTPPSGAISGASTLPHDSASPFEQGRSYDWMKKPGE